MIRGNFEICNDCNYQFCGDCFNLTPCDVCQKTVCEECFDKASESECCGSRNCKECGCGCEENE
jgi:hypothetical protein